jgi:hypothetical protein
MYILGVFMSRIVCEVPDDEFLFIKLCSKRLGITVKQFILDAVNKMIDDYESKWDVERLLSEKKEVLKEEEYFFEKDGIRFVRYKDGSESRLYSSDEMWEMIHGDSSDV